MKGILVFSSHVYLKSSQNYRVAQEPNPGTGNRNRQNRFFPKPKADQEDVNGEKLTVEKWWIFGADFFTVWCRFFHGLRRFF